MVDILAASDGVNKTRDLPTNFSVRSCDLVDRFQFLIRNKHQLH